MRSNRQRMSCNVLLSACPIWREPVTFGGGITMVKGLASFRSGRPARNAPSFSQTSRIRASIEAGSNLLSIMRATSPPRLGAIKINYGCKKPTSLFLSTEQRPRMTHQMTEWLAFFCHSFDFSLNQSLNDSWQVCIEPIFKHRAQGRLDNGLHCR